LNRRWNIAHLQIAEAPNFVRYIFQNVFRPPLGSVKSGPNGVFTGQKAADDGFEDGPLVVRLAPSLRMMRTLDSAHGNSSTAPRVQWGLV
jgi:hypothetical protein